MYGIILLIGIAACVIIYFCTQYYIFKDKYIKQMIAQLQQKIFNINHE